MYEFVLCYLGRAEVCIGDAAMPWKQHSGRLFSRGDVAVTLFDYVWRIEVPDKKDVLWLYRQLLPFTFTTAQAAMTYIDGMLKEVAAPQPAVGSPSTARENERNPRGSSEGI